MNIGKFSSDDRVLTVIANAKTYNTEWLCVLVYYTALFVVICLCLYLTRLALYPKFISKHSDHITLAPNKPTDKRIAVIADKDTFGKYFGKTLRNTYVKAKPETVLDVYCEIPQNAEGYDKFIVTGKFAQTFQPPTSAKIVYINPIDNPPPPSVLTNATIYLPRFDIYNQNSKWINAAKKANSDCIFTESPSAQISNDCFNWYFNRREYPYFSDNSASFVNPFCKIFKNVEFRIAASFHNVS